jgi:acyl-CoA synthetase (AMP-forming)/AMP-acid ligase II
MMNSLPKMLFQSAARRPGHVALQDERVELRYDELAARVRDDARRLLSLGLANQGRVAVFLEKSVDACALVLAAMHAGGIAVPLNPKLMPQQVRHIVADSGAELLLTTAARLGEMRAVLQGLDVRVLAAGELAEVPADPARAPYRRIATDPAALLYTSGSTGQPKGVIVSHLNLVVGCESVCEYLGIREDDVILSLLPISFDAGLSQVSTGLAVGARVVLHTPMLAQGTAALIARHHITAITAVPPMWSLLTQARWDAVDTSSVRLFANTGGHMSATLLGKLRAIFPQARPFLMYGLTEAFRSTYLDPDELARRPDSIGKARRTSPANWCTADPWSPSATGTRRRSRPSASARSRTKVCARDARPNTPSGRATSSSATKMGSCISSAAATSRSSRTATASARRNWKTRSVRWRACRTSPCSACRPATSATRCMRSCRRSRRSATARR